MQKDLILSLGYDTSDWIFEMVDMEHSTVQPDIRYSQPTNHIHHCWPLTSLPETLQTLPRPEKVRFRHLDASHVSLLCDSWKFTSPGTQNMINVLVRLNRVFGLVSEEADGDSEPLAWMLIYR